MYGSASNVCAFCTNIDLSGARASTEQDARLVLGAHTVNDQVVAAVERAESNEPQKREQGWRGCYSMERGDRTRSADAMLPDDLRETVLASLDGSGAAAALVAPMVPDRSAPGGAEPSPYGLDGFTGQPSGEGTAVEPATATGGATGCATDDDMPTASSTRATAETEGLVCPVCGPVPDPVQQPKPRGERSLNIRRAS